jgi:hypothetical protein
VIHVTGIADAGREVLVKTTAVLAVLLLTLCVVMPANAQISAGFTAGVNVASIGVDPDVEDSDFSSRTAFGFGGVLDYSLSEVIMLQIMPMYLQKGTKEDYEWDDPFSSGTGEADWKLAYFEIPIMFKYLFAGDFQPYVMAGATIGFLLSAEVEWTEEGHSGTADIKEDLKGLDFGLGFGGGVRVPVGNNTAFVEARYGLGLTQIFGGFVFPIGGQPE